MHEDEEEESGLEEIPKAADGLHPERAKAVVANSEFASPKTIYGTDSK